MTLSSHDLALSAAAQLAPEFPTGLEALVEAELAKHGDDTVETFVDPATTISLASLLVSAAGLAWTIYRDLKSDRQAPAAQAIERHVSLKLEEQGKAGSEHFRRVVEVVSEQVVKADPT